MPHAVRAAVRPADQGDVLLRLDGGQDHGAEILDAMRARVATLGLGLERARGVRRVDPAHRAGGRDAEGLSRGTTGEPICDSTNQPGPEINGSRLAHARWLPAQPCRVNHVWPASGSANDSHRTVRAGWTYATAKRITNFFGDLPDYKDYPVNADGRGSKLLQ